MKLGQLIEYNKRNFFIFQRLCGKKAGRLVLDLVLFFKKAQHEVKESGLQMFQ